MAKNPITLKKLVGLLKKAIASFPDTRAGKNAGYGMEDFALSAFSGVIRLFVSSQTGHF